MSAPRGWLAPLGVVYGTAAAVRVSLYRRGILPGARLEGPVISVGNLRVGGSGKTPAVALLARVLHEAGFPVTVLSRGYGGTFSGEALVVSDGRALLADAATAGDEPVMLARMLPEVVIAVGRRRDRVGRMVEARFGRRVHVLDDGFQHLRLRRDLDVLCAEADDLQQRPLPAGPLREFPSAVQRADVLLLGGDGAAASLPVPTVLAMRRCVEGFFSREGESRPAPRRPFLLAAIARPERLEADVAARVEAVAGRAFFRDHHRFSAADLAGVEQQALAAGADALVTTAKDAERLPAAWAPRPLLVLRIRAEVDEPQRLRERLLATVRARW